MKSSKRYLSVLLCFVMVLSQMCLFPFPSKAASYNEAIWFGEGDEITLTGINDSITLNIVGDDYDFTSVEWKSDDTSVAIVDDNGNVTAQGKGSTYIYAIAQKDKASPSDATPDEASPSITKVTVTARCKVTVEIPVSEFTILTNDFTLAYKNATRLLQYVINPSDASNQDIIWRSSNNTVAVVDVKGKVTALSEGDAVITGITKDGGYEDSCNVHVDFNDISGGDNYDTTAPILNDLEILTPDITIPGKLRIKLNITEEETGVSSIFINTMCWKDEALSMNNTNHNFEPGTHYSGDYIIEIDMDDESFMSGEWTIGYVTITDGQYNNADYYLEYKFNVINDKRDDFTAPEVIDFTTDVTSLTIPGNIPFTVDIIEEGSGLYGMLARLTNINTGEIVDRGYNFDPKVSKSGKYNLDFNITELNLTPGIWEFAVASCWDYQRNEKDYNGDKIKIEIINPNKTDFTAPTIESIKVLSPEIITPGVVEIEVEIIEEESTVSWMGANFYNEEAGTYQSISFNVKENNNGGKSGIYKSSYPVNMYTKPGTWKMIWIDVGDSAGNIREYNFPNNGLYEHLEENYSFITKNELDIQVQTSLANPNLPNLIRNMSESGIALINPDIDVISEDVFQALQGSDKSIVINDDGIQWVFNGKDITSDNIKPIDISTKLKVVNGISNGFDEDVMQITFKNNGTLPGIAKIRLKSDYLYAKYNASGNLVLSWLNNNGVNVESDDVLCEEDTYTEFYISHNSTFLISSQTPDEKLVDIVLTPPTKNNYKVGENLDLSEMSLFAVYESGAKRIITDYDISGFNNQVVGSQIITVKYGNKEVSFTINVEESKNAVPDDPTPEVPDDNNHNNGSSGGSGGGGGSSSGSRKTGGATNSSKNTPGKWIQDENGWWFQKTDGSYPKDEWIINNNLWYHFDSRGYMQTGWIEVGSIKYFLNQDGSMASNNWILFNNKWYYFDQTGAMKTGWIQWNNLWYYLNLDGSMATNINTPDGYHIDENGVWVQ